MIRHQNNFATQPTQVRVVIHLQDIRIIALGVLLAQPSLFVNPNAHLLLHPPLLRGLADGDSPPKPGFTLTPSQHPTPAAGPTAPGGFNEAYFPLIRTMSSSGPSTTSQSVRNTGHTNISSLRSTISSLLPGRVRGASSTGEDESGPRLGGRLTMVRSRHSDDGRRRTFSFGRTRAGSISTPSADAAPEPRLSFDPGSPPLPTLPELPSQSSSSHKATTDSLGVAQSRRHTEPYSKLLKPLPASTHSLFPNYTPSSQAPTLPAFEIDISADPGTVIYTKMDRRSLHLEVEDNSDGQIWSAGEAVWSGDGAKMAEWDLELEVRKRWVGPMM